MFISSHVPLSLCWSLILPPWASPAFSVSALVDFRRGSCLSAILRQSRDPEVKECEPGGCDNQDLPSGQTMANTSAQRPNDLTCFLCSSEHTFFLSSWPCPQWSGIKTKENCQQFPPQSAQISHVSLCWLNLEKKWDEIQWDLMFLISFSDSSLTRQCSEYLSMHSSWLETIVNATERGHDCFYGWACYEWLQVQRRPKGPLSHLSPTLREEGKRRRLAVKASVARYIVTVASHSLWPKHISSSEETTKQRERHNRAKWYWFSVDLRTSISRGLRHWGVPKQRRIYTEGGEGSPGY